MSIAAAIAAIASVAKSLLQAITDNLASLLSAGMIKDPTVLATVTRDVNAIVNARSSSVITLNPASSARGTHSLDPSPGRLNPEHLDWHRG
jgi:hypothetical protein